MINTVEGHIIDVVAGEVKRNQIVRISVVPKRFRFEGAKR